MLKHSVFIILLLASCSQSNIDNDSSSETNQKEDTLTHSITVEEKILKEEVTNLKDTITQNSPLGTRVNDFSDILYLNQDLELLKIEWRVETSISISGEGPHCDLIYWKHAYTPWKVVIQDSIPEHEVRIYDQFPEAENLFPLVDLDEFKKYVRGYCKENWYQHMKKVQSITEYPSGIGISKVIYRVNFKSKNGKKFYSKIYYQDLAMGC